MLDAGELSDVGERKRLTLLACLVHTARIRARDEVVTMFCKRMAAITKKARECLEGVEPRYGGNLPSDTYWLVSDLLVVDQQLWRCDPAGTSP